MKKRVELFTNVSLLLLIAAGCEKPRPAAETPKPPAPAIVPPGFVLAEAPAGAKDVAAVKSAGFMDGDEVVIHGIVGGEPQPISQTQAVVRLIDPSVMTCDKMGMAGECKTPWDACCHQKEATEKGMTVRVVDSTGNPLKGSLEGIGGLKPGKDVTVKGRARKGEKDALIVEATGVFVKG